MRVVVTGSTGLVGSRLVPILLKAGHAVVATSRDPESVRRLPGVLPLGWDGAGMLQVPGKVDAIVHLAGEPVLGRRWTDAQKERLVGSRVGSTKRIAEFVARRRPAERPRALVCANAVGYYGIRPEGESTEDAPAGTDFLALLCKAWQEAAEQAECRTVVLRLGHVLSKDGGYLGKLLPLARFGLAGPLGGGRQPMPWVHIDDVCGAILWALSSPQAQGPYNVVSPGATTQRGFAKALNRAMPVLAVPSLLPVPALALRARFGEAAGPILGGQDAPPRRLLAEGYGFGHPSLDEALASLLRPRRKAPPQAKAQALAAAAAEAAAGEEE